MAKNNLYAELERKATRAIIGRSFYRWESAIIVSLTLALTFSAGAFIDALEAGDWGRIGAAVFVRGQLRSYARLLGIDLGQDLLRAEVGAVTPPELVSHSHTPRYRRLLEQTTRRAVYIAITAVIAVPVWLACNTRTGAGPAGCGAAGSSVSAVPAAAVLTARLRRRRSR